MGPKTRGGKGTRIPVRRNLSPSSVASPDVTMPSIASPGVAPPVVGSSSASRRRESLRQSSPGVAPPEQSSPLAPPRTHLGEASTSNPDFDTEALQPELYFPNTQFSKGCSIASKCEEYIKIHDL